MIRRPPRSTRTDPLFPDTTLFRSVNMAGTVPATNTVPAIALDGVSKSFDGGAHFALRDICLSIAPGDLVAMVGASGSGKTTLLKCINRLVEPDSGAILINEIGRAHV